MDDQRATASTNMQTDNILLKTERLTLTPRRLDDAGALLEYYERNRLNFRPWEPKRDNSFFTLQSMRDRVSATREMMINQQSLHFLLRERDSVEIIGECGFANIVRGPFQACHLGFSICKRHEGQGVMYEALRCAIDFVFRELELHRVMANYRPENERSHRLLQRLGFEQEGRARSYLKIDGGWRDHILTSLINETFS
jgi:ribosomal-protein-alanine N-acetyltransferase